MRRVETRPIPRPGRTFGVMPLSMMPLDSAQLRSWAIESMVVDMFWVMVSMLRFALLSLTQVFEFQT